MTLIVQYCNPVRHILFGLCNKVTRCIIFSYKTNVIRKF